MSHRTGKGDKLNICLRVILFLLLSISLASGENPALKKASFMPHWVPQAQFAGYYVAYEKGIYRKYGLDLVIIEGGPGRSSADYLKNRKTDFSTLWLSTAIQRRSEGMRLVNVGQIVQKSALMLVAKKSRGITSAKDLEGKKVGIWEGDFAIQPRAFFKKNNLHVKIVPQSFSINLFLRDGVDAASAMWYNEYHSIINSGLDPEELTTFFYQDYGLNFPEDGIYTLEDTFRKDPQMVCAFVKASIEGWMYAFSHPDEAIDIMLRRMIAAGVPANRMHQKWMLERMKDLISPGGRPFAARLKREDYEAVARELRRNGLIRQIPDFGRFYVRCGAL